MKKSKKTTFMALACSLALGVSVAAACTACGKPSATIHDDIVNGGFETGDLTGWSAAGDYAFDADAIVETEAVEGLGVTVSGKVGKYYLNGLAAANATSTGTLTSEPFKLGGTGDIGFKVGAGSDAAKCYVEFLEHGSNTVLAKVSNEAYDEGFIDDDLVRVVVDLSSHIGKDIYIRVTDNGTTQQSHEYFHLDDFVMYKTEAEVTTATAERNNLIKMFGRPVFENDTPTAKTIKNGNFEDGLNNWHVVEGDAYTPKAIKPSTEKFWGTREYNAEGNYFLDGFATGEDRTGAIRSTTFTLAETGIISFLLSSSPQKAIYVAVCNDEEIGGIAKDTELFKVEAKEVFKDNELSENMLRRYINAKSYTPAATDEEPTPTAVDLIGKKLYIKLVDNTSTGEGGFHAICFDDVRCSMTEEEVLALEKSDYEWAMALTGRGAEEISYTQNYYANYNYPVALPIMRFTKTASGVALKASKAEVDVNAFIADVKASYGDAADSEFAYEVTKINYKDADITANFDKVVFDTVGTATVTYQAKVEDMVLSATFEIEITDEHQISNGKFELGSLIGWTYEQGTGDGQVNGDLSISSADTFWNENMSFNKSGKFFFNGWNANATEGNAYTLKSTVFTLGGSGIISFKMGGNAAVVRVYYEGGNLLAEYKNTQFVDQNFPHVEQGSRLATMTTFYADLSEFKGLNLYIELVDTGAAAWGVAFFDDIITYYEGETAEVLATLANKTDAVHYACKYNENGVDKTHDGDTQIAWVAAENVVIPELIQITAKVDSYNESAATMRDLNEYLADVTGAVIGVPNPTLSKAITKVSDGTTDYTEGFTAFNLAAGKTYTVTYALTYNDGTQDYTASAEFVIKVLTVNEIQNASFETGDLTGWTYNEGTNDGEIEQAKVIRTEDTFWGERIPLNKKGNYMFNGMGDYIPEAYKYNLKSSTFTLGGSGVISFKMGGNAAVVKVFKADGTQIAEYNNTEFADKEFPHVEKGGRWATMTTFVADLSAHIGEQLYIELHDTKTEGWGIATFDDIVTYYQTAPVVAECFDNVTIYCENADGTIYDMPWIEAVNELATNN